jgi:hypothetical protein
MTTAQQPFQFMTATYLTRVETFKVDTISAMHHGLSEAGDSTIFYHTFQTLGQHHFLTEGFSNDFAQWVLGSCNQPVLAERLAGIDIRDYTSTQEMREDLRRIFGDFCTEKPGPADQRAFEPFYFCSAVEVTLPLPWDAHTLPGLRAGLERMSHSSFYYHFIASRLRLGLRTNDFSHWFRTALNMNRLADRTDRIDVYTNTLDTARRELIEIVDREIGQ